MAIEGVRGNKTSVKYKNFVSYVLSAQQNITAKSNTVLSLLIQTLAVSVDKRSCIFAALEAAAWLWKHWKLHHSSTPPHHSAPCCSQAQDKTIALASKLAAVLNPNSSPVVTSRTAVLAELAVET